MIGKNMKHALIFLTKDTIQCIRGDWYTYDNKERSTRNAIQSLVNLGYVEIHKEFPMFRATELGRLKAREFGWIL